MSDTSQNTPPPLVTVNPAHQAEDLSLCKGPANIQLNNFAGVVDWINAMPKPLTLACFIASLPRPLTYNATFSRSSVQPAIGKLNPRIFIQYEKLWLSFVPQEAMTAVKDPLTGERTSVWDSDGIQLLEFSLEVDSDLPVPQSIKGELAFPILKNIPRNAPYARIADSSRESTCKACHANETIIGSLDGAPIFRSKMLRSAKQTLMQPDDIFLHYYACDPQINTGPGTENNEWYRCQMLKAFVEHGPIEWQNFRSDITPCIQE
ncbi:MAG TPA: hypothetical protein PK011_14310 [Marinagarivorans sp.]|nr:hypothetical protein [Cellvibrionaceae bacterium]HMY40494.1 hypothetical protein [Marinagarivorans sp.]HNG59428.1 hypothetical protein [Cellvibrionaceae bacterium]